ncbi:hypothetical protein KIPB_007428 [Kipferlia bialata]|uniref:Uncharacterized protein n=1 Tax=Kipferlia bialata TaxID=797122 RepID=A0A9K3CYK1_9EUKA|nr:hypothetical protein KIPB_007428 [Kipferlia bialata]|eukprot:g7428.t1
MSYMDSRDKEEYEAAREILARASQRENERAALKMQRERRMAEQAEASRQRREEERMAELLRREEKLAQYYEARRDKTLAELRSFHEKKYDTQQRLAALRERVSAPPRPSRSVQRLEIREAVKLLEDIVASQVRSSLEEERFIQHEMFLARQAEMRLMSMADAEGRAMRVVDKAHAQAKEREAERQAALDRAQQGVEAHVAEMAKAQEAKVLRETRERQAAVRRAEEVEAEAEEALKAESRRAMGLDPTLIEQLLHLEPVDMGAEGVSIRELESGESVSYILDPAVAVENPTPLPPDTPQSLRILVEQKDQQRETLLRQLATLKQEGDVVTSDLLDTQQSRCCHVIEPGLGMDYAWDQYRLLE